MIKFQHPRENCYITVDHPGGYCCEFQVVKELLQAYSSEPCVHCKKHIELIERLEDQLCEALSDADYWEEETAKLAEEAHALTELGEGAWDKYASAFKKDKKE